jgi:hypothetical protein
MTREWSPTSGTLYIVVRVSIGSETIRSRNALLIQKSIGRSEDIMGLTRIFTLVWIIGCGIIIIFIVRNPVPPPPPECLACNLRLVFGVASILVGVGGLIAGAIARNRTGLSTPR